MIDCITSNGILVRTVVGIDLFLLCSLVCCIWWPVTVWFIWRCGWVIVGNLFVLSRGLVVVWLLYFGERVCFALFLGAVLVAGRFSILFLDCRFPRWGWCMRKTPAYSSFHLCEQLSLPWEGIPQYEHCGWLLIEYIIWPDSVCQYLGFPVLSVSLANLFDIWLWLRIRV